MSGNIVTRAVGGGSNQIYIGGNVVLDAQTELKTETIDSTSTQFLAKNTGGNVTLSTQTKDIIVDSIYTYGGNKDFALGKASRADSEGLLGGNVTINSVGLFRVLREGGINSSLFGIIDIQHGSKQPFASGVTFEPNQNGEKAIPKPGFTFPDGVSGSRGAIVTSTNINGSLNIVYKDQPINGISIKSVSKDTNSVVKKDDNNTVVKKDDNNTVAKKDDNNTVAKDEKQRSKQDCTPSSTSVAANSTTDPNRAEGNASAPSADPCQLVTGTAGGTLQILNNRE